MSVQLVANVLIGIALVVFLGYRQATWRYLDPTRIWRTPLIMAIVGVVVLAQTTTTITTTDVVFLGIEALITVGVGLTMGSITRFRTVATPDSKGRTIQSRTGLLGAALWIVLIAVRVGLDVVGGHLGAHLLTSTGTILLVLALNRAARAVVIDQRIPRDDREARGMMVR
ncbi:hypothetical protein GCM10017714_27880 [Curtobacterium pusillum]|uniref:DUF1453 domain-containing protein n=1 Tax=Curtobacterium pusillum TaxID=69373 RepID=A0AAW3T3Y4_9MICO|nr:hypothetical protein [Curtobacterium pusillum]MBA8989142.1 hypothetical protein [Curtobacterium pusillum]NUU13363.1 hypothetical protein [Curtobacterium pusillum]GLK32918.1 hypothetical protein GCM10017610_32030 [Curtobacterium pusillum]